MSRVSFIKSASSAAFMLFMASLAVSRGSAQTGSMRGFADIHNHQFANLAFGGRFLAGNAYGPIDQVLAPQICYDDHTSNHTWSTTDIWGGYMAGYPGPIGYSNNGYPDFKGWPAFFEVAHQHVHQDWLQRAVQGGMRLMVMMAVESPPLCGMVPGDGRDCNDEMTSLYRQLDEAHKMQDYIDQQAGGSGLGWYRIVTTPADARRVIGQGKLAVVLGVETAHLFNCKTEPCNWQAGLDYLWNVKGVRHFFPIHQDNNAFGGASYFVPTAQSDLFSPYKLSTHPCAHGMRGMCNDLGLTLTGKDFVGELMRRGALIDVDHMSDLAFKDTLDLADTLGYPVVAGHSSFNDIKVKNSDQDHEGQLTVAELGRIQKNGGMLGLISSPGDINEVITYDRPGKATIKHACGRSSESFVQPFYYAIDHAAGMPLAIGTDFNGALRQIGPRFPDTQDIDRSCDGGRNGSDPRSQDHLATGFYARGANINLPPLRSGTRTYDFNQHGLANVGLLPDLFGDLEVIGVAASDLEPIFNSAEGYVKMWERACMVGGGTSSGCGTDLPLSNLDITSGTATYRAPGSLTASNVTVSADASITLQAPNYVRLAPEFRATAGTAPITFHARIQ